MASLKCDTSSVTKKVIKLFLELFYIRIVYISKNATTLGSIRTTNTNMSTKRIP